VKARLQELLHTAQGVAGGVVGVARGDDQFALAHGVANLNTAQPFTDDTGFLLGSVTKVLTTTIVMGLVDRGLVDLDAPAGRYVPEFTLTDRDAAERITVRMLLNHTNGMDADTLMPSPVRGRDAQRSYTEKLARQGVLFEPGTGIHYTNPGFVVAGRVIEEITGQPFERAIQQELFGPAGMRDATALQTQAFLRRTAIGAFGKPDGTLRATSLFTLSESAAGAGGTPIVTVADMLAFGRLHLSGGGDVLSEESVRAMQSATFDLGIPQAPPIGLGWWLVPIAGVTAPWHGGGSPGGTSSFCIVPEHDAAIVSFATGPGSGALNDALHSAVLEELTGEAPSSPVAFAPEPVDASLAGEYRAFERRVVVEVDGTALVLTDHHEPLDDDQRDVLSSFVGGETTPPAVRYTSIGPRLYAVEGTQAEAVAGFYGRMGLVAALPGVPGRRPGLHSGFRYVPKVG
jgi:CubicO group peptidase (beta-lactamase class C family)